MFNFFNVAIRVERTYQKFNPAGLQNFDKKFGLDEMSSVRAWLLPIALKLKYNIA